ncbi:MAG: DUF58 domain-containing protein [Verrucomicrobiales bacterium]|nr:DUF58 domain-containing protein [Verrucomicrobiales bacterium]
MIVPTSRLLFWVAAIVVPGAMLMPILPATIVPVVLCVVVFVVLITGDAVKGRTRLARLSVELPEVIRVAKDRVAEIVIRIGNESTRTQRLRLGLPFPREIESGREDLVATLPEGSRHSRLTWPCTARRRGSYFLKQAFVECPSPLGFWAVRSAVPVRSEIRVYPDLRPERKNLAALFLNRGALGLHVQRQVGKGREFEKLREYIPGDSSEDIHWKATAKRGHPVTKVFQIERTQEIYVVIDSSRLSARPVGSGLKFQVSSVGASGNVEAEMRKAKSGSGDVQLETPNSKLETTTLERYVTAALTLGLAAEQQGDLFGLVTFSDRVQHFVRAKNGKEHYALCRDAIYGLQPSIVTPDFEELGTFLRVRLRRRALLLFLTALDDPVLAESFIRTAESLARQHLILVNMLQPVAARPLFAEPNVASVDQVYERLGGHLLWHDLKQLGQTLHHRGVRFALVENERLSADLISQYLSVKQRQLL